MEFFSIKKELSYFDFIRGWAAILVFFHHAAILGGGPTFLINNVGTEAVNLFMFASGFLIFYQASINNTYDGFSNKNGIKNFYIRRFFRIAPVYYLILPVAYILSYTIGDARLSIGAILPQTLTDMSRYYIIDYISNALYHVSFLFGFIPSYAFSTPLPDWSLGLEMQFYVIFPFLYILFRRNFLLYITIFLILMLSVNIGLNSLHISFPMPSFIAMKFHNFAAGMAIAFLYLNKESRNKKLLLAVVMLFCYLGEKTIIMPLVIIFSFWYFLDNRLKIDKYKNLFDNIFANKTSIFLANISYPLYLIHLLFMIPYFAFLLNWFEVKSAQETTLWFVESITLLIFMILISMFIHKFIEIPGIKIGKSLITKGSR
jgi:peptidoglycan/LPS O-acetylase OafA/YrhL